MANLTAGDFAILARRLRFKNKKIDLEEAIGILKAESEIKMPNKPIGFYPHR